jgi:hypothetical protein
VRSAVVAFFVVLGALGGCARPGDAAYLSSWDGEAPGWEGPPPRVVTGADGGVNAGGGGGGLGAGGANNLVQCAKPGQGNCCWPVKNGQADGFPRCDWMPLGPGQSATITAAFKVDAPVTLPVPLSLTGASPSGFASFDECVKAVVGFTLSGPGLEEGQLVGDISHFTLGADGTWHGAGGGGTQSLVAAIDVQASNRDGGIAGPAYMVGEGLCKELMMMGRTAIIFYFDQIDFTLGGVDYRANFRSNPNGGVGGYYVVIARNF